MKRLISSCLALVLALASSTTLALPGTFAIDQLYSNADGSVQFVVIRDDGANDCDSGENRWAGQTLVGGGPEPQRVYVFPHDLSTCRTSDKRMLIATEGFAALGLVTPDYVIPNGFVQMPQGWVIFANVGYISYAALPNDGIHAIDSRGHVIQNVATNFAGASASVVPMAAPPVNVVEYYNAALDHYFITWVAAEQANLDAGNTPTKWTRTGYSFQAYTSAQAGTSPVCRYYLPPAYGDSHFFGAARRSATRPRSTPHAPSCSSDALFHARLPAGRRAYAPRHDAHLSRLQQSSPTPTIAYMTDRAVRDQDGGARLACGGRRAPEPRLSCMCGVEPVIGRDARPSDALLARAFLPRRPRAAQ
jgi:hypothetical protein